MMCITEIGQSLILRLHRLQCLCRSYEDSPHQEDHGTYLKYQTKSVIEVSPTCFLVQINPSRVEMKHPI